MLQYIFVPSSNVKKGFYECHNMIFVPIRMSKWDFECQTTIFGPVSNVKKKKKKEKQKTKSEKRIGNNKKQKTNTEKRKAKNKPTSPCSSLLKCL